MTDDPRGRCDGVRPVRDRRVRELAAHLEATAELPIDRRTNRWLGEAEAVATDAATSDLDDETIRERVRQVDHLLGAAGETGRDEVDDHLEAARRLCREVLEREPENG